VNLAVLVSGGGTNLQAILDADLPVRVVVSNRKRAFGLERARRAGVPAEVVSHRGFPSREDHDAAVVTALRRHGVDTVALAGFMRIVTPTLLDAFPGRVVNIHPALCPAFPGLHAQRQALEHGARVTGATVHFVDAGVDTGAIIIQGAVPVLDDDDEASLSARVLEVEHRIYPEALRLLGAGRLTVKGRRVRIKQLEGPR